MISHRCVYRVIAGTLMWTRLVGQGWLSNWEMQLHLSRLRSTWSTFFGILFVLSPHSGLRWCVLFHLSKYCTAFLPHRSEHVFDERVFFHLSVSHSHHYIFLSPVFIRTPPNLKTCNIVRAEGTSLVRISVHLQFYCTVWRHFLVNYCYSLMYAPMNLPHCKTCDLKGYGMPNSSCSSTSLQCMITGA